MNGGSVGERWGDTSRASSDALRGAVRHGAADRIVAGGAQTPQALLCLDNLSGQRREFPEASVGAHRSKQRTRKDTSVAGPAPSVGAARDAA
jgi:hypothetical protein